MSEITVKEFYEINGPVEYERSTTILPRLWPIKKMSYGYNSSNDYCHERGERNYIVLYSNSGESSPWWIGYQRKLKFVLSNGEVVIIDGSGTVDGRFGYDENAEPIKKLMKFIDDFNDGFMGNLYNMEDDTFDDI